MQDIDKQPLLTRRRMLTGGIQLAASAALLPALGAECVASGGKKKPDHFSFVHITDTHIQPELSAVDGVKKAFDTIRALPEKPSFGLVGGDLVMDATGVEKGRADTLYELWRTEAEALGLPLHYSVGNHDTYGNTSGKVTTSDPEYGKAYWKERLHLERTYDTFEHGGWRFVTLDSVAISPDGAWSGAIDDEQVKWIDDLLRKAGKKQPIVFLTHIPLLTLYGQYTEGTTAALSDKMIVKNGKAFQEMVQGYNVKAVFQGHTHVVEECEYLGVRYITGGAVCGDWWKGPRLGVHPEGFGVITVSSDDFTYRYVPYGWKAAHPA